MRKERVVVVSALGRWESAKKKTREETIVERVCARLSQSWWRHHFVVHPKHLDSLASVPKKREPQTKKKKWHRNPPRGDASAPTLGDHHRIVLFVGRPLSPKSFPRTEIAVASTPTSRKFVQGARFFFFRSRHHERKRPNTTHLRAANRWPRRCANVGNPRAASVRVAFVFRSAKKRTIFLFFVFFFFCCCCYFVAMGLERVLCGAPNAYSF